MTFVFTERPVKPAPRSTVRETQSVVNYWLGLAGTAPAGRDATDDDDDAVPMSYIPGLVDGVTMARIKQLVADGAVPFTIRGNAKMVKPSDVRAAVDAAALEN